MNSSPFIELFVPMLLKGVIMQDMQTHISLKGGILSNVNVTSA